MEPRLMAKFYVAYKSPDTPYESMSEAKHELPAGDVERVCDKFGIGEELILELDTEAMTCVIVPEKSRTESEEYYAKVTKEWQEERDEEAAEAAQWEEMANTPDDGTEADFEKPGMPLLVNSGAAFRTRTSPSMRVHVPVETKPDFEGESITRIPIPKSRSLPYRNIY
jgi:hypothetical protein